MAVNKSQTALGDIAARQLAIATRTVPQLPIITPRWLTHLLSWIPVEAGIYRVNKVKDHSTIQVDCSGRDEHLLPQSYVDYIENPREYLLSSVNTVVDVHTRISDLYSKPYNQISEQLRLTIETIKERQESELINNKEYGLLSSVVPSQVIKTRTGAPTPDDLDEFDYKGLERTRILFTASVGDCSIWKGGYKTWCAATNGIFIWITVFDLAWYSVNSFGQSSGCK